jgi:adenylyl-sulfate kinase
VCNLAVDRPIAFDPYRDNRDTGGFILIDRLSNDTVGAGLLHFALRRSQNIRWQATDIGKQARSAQKGQKACILWFTGLSGAGKSTIADLVERELYVRGLHTYLLDGDNVRHGLNRDRGFTDEDRVENIRRVAEVAKLMVDAGLIVLVSFISHFRSERRMARELVGPDEFIEIFVDAPLAVADRPRPAASIRRQATLSEGLPQGALFFPWRSKAPNPYVGLLALADRCVVTGDSLSMIVEAARAGKPLAIAPVYPSSRPALWLLEATGLAPRAFDPLRRDRATRLLRRLAAIGTSGGPRDTTRLHQCLYENAWAVASPS